MLGRFAAVEVGMTPSQAETIAAADKATVAIVSTLISFLEKQGVIRREDFAAFLMAAIEGWRSEGADEKFLRLVALKARGLTIDLPPSVQN
jgi:SOS-response transcriptional repressor LexA